LIWTEIVFLTGQVIFVPEWPKGEFVSFFVGYILLDKITLCNVAAFTGMLRYPESTLQLCSSRRFCEVFKEVYFGSLSAIRMTYSPVQTLISQ
jgi:hypothetical protein